MALLLIFFFAFVAAASFSDTRAPPFCGNPFPLTSENLDFFEGLANGSIDAAQGSSDLLNKQNYGGPRPWPRNSENKVVIQYCFQTPDVRDKIGQQFREFGIDEWMRALGGAASSATGHGLVFEETLDVNGRPFSCKYPDGSWNQKVDKNAVMIGWSYSKHFAGGATVGFVGFVSGDPPVPGIHGIIFGHTWINPTLVHELGHVLGMAHEHQRKDRDGSVAYRCHNVQGFYTKFEKFKASNPDAKWSDLCDDLINALLMDFAGKNFVRQFSLGDARSREGRFIIWEVADYGEPYDQQSIMHYHSDIHVADDLYCLRGPGLTDGCTLVNNLPGHEKEYIRRSHRPSAGDIKWVRKTYPWMDPPKNA
ncbi:zincin [Karstenula rhodostoma CBS 690.94]|uniref:Metalloendopeptidase n=1 Tax=Karstenula rhodostoma CBS 690.94 TaxID=1392251 RepID=A0A9P4UJE7_9PLEO|nr:zincin [Karstenula rhodostoma CBS 690.94]